MISETYDAVVAGSRVAGAITARLLGQAGHRVLLVDRAQFPSPTLSTHFFRGAGLIAVLERLDILDQVLALGAPPLVRQYSYLGGSALATVQPPQSPGAAGFCLSVRREALDHILVRRAAETPGVELLLGARVSGLLWDGACVAGVELQTPAGRRAVQARIVIGADGRHSFVAKAVRAPVERSAPPYRVMYYCYVRHFLSPFGGAPDGPEFSLIADELSYVFPSDGGLTCIALTLNISQFESMRRAPEEGFRRRLALHPGLAERFAAAQIEGRVLGSGPEPNYLRAAGGPGWALVGDAGIHQDPWSGIGMDFAGTHAVYLAEELNRWLRGQATQSEALASYELRRNEHATEEHVATVTQARDLSRPHPAV